MPETLVSHFGGHYEGDVVHVPSYVDSLSSVGRHLGVPRYVSTELFFRIFHEKGEGQGAEEHP